MLPEMGGHRSHQGAVPEPGTSWDQPGWRGGTCPRMICTPSLGQMPDNFRSSGTGTNKLSPPLNPHHCQLSRCKEGVPALVINCGATQKGRVTYKT